MSRPVDALADLLEPLRDLGISRLMHGIADELERGSKVRHEPKIRDGEDRIRRDGPLHLPRRADMAVTRDGATSVRWLPDCEQLSFEPLTLARSDGLVAIVHPFGWDAARMFAESASKSLNWTPIRRWFLEAFQSRYGELAPDLDGAVHAISGPRERDDGWEFEIDFGSAPIAAFTELLDAFALAGANRLLISARLKPHAEQPIGA